MMRQTGGTAVAAISTRSSPFCRAMASACGGGMIPSCVPSSSMTRTSRTLMRSLTRVRSSRRGETRLGLALRRHFLQRPRHEVLDGARAEIAAAPAADRHRAVRRLAVPDHQHIGDLLELRLADLEVDLFLTGVEFGPQSRRF